MPAANASTYGTASGTRVPKISIAPAPSDAADRGAEVEQQRARARVAGGEQDREVAGFLRDLVRRDRERRGHAERHGHERGGGDHDAVDERVHHVADDDQRRGRLVDVALMPVVAVPPEHEFLENEERQDAGEQRAEDRRRRQRSRAPAARSPSSAAPSSVPTAYDTSHGTMRLRSG